MGCGRKRAHVAILLEVGVALILEDRKNHNLHENKSLEVQRVLLQAARCSAARRPDFCILKFAIWVQTSEYSIHAAGTMITTQAPIPMFIGMSHLKNP
jgi:hypothetical protein